MSFPKRLIEVDFPIARVSDHSRREKAVRQGHLSSLHLWWARRPLAACRAIICGALWIDPADSLCPAEYREVAHRSLQGFARRLFPDRITTECQQLRESVSASTLPKWEDFAKQGDAYVNTDEANIALRGSLFDFISDFADWDNSAEAAYLDTSRAITSAAHSSLGGLMGSVPLVIDPFAGGGAIPLECVRIGADVFASDLNPLPVLLNKVVLEFIPRYGRKLASELDRWGPIVCS